MILKEALNLTKLALFKSEIPDAFTEAEILLCHTVRFSRRQLHTYPEKELNEEEQISLNHLINRRIMREPTAYILQRRWFYCSDFYVDNRVLIPRPETELLVEKTIDFVTTQLSTKNTYTIADIGTGSGAIAASLALALPNAIIYATDISAQALEVACLNFHYHNIDDRIIPLQGNLLSPLPETVDVIVANLPYIARNDLARLAPEIYNYEPLIALDGGKDGVDRIRNLLYQSSEKIQPDGCIFLEIGQNQDNLLLPLVQRLFPRARTRMIADLAGINRVMEINGGIRSLPQVAVCNQSGSNIELSVS